MDLSKLTTKQLGTLIRIGDPRAVRHVTRALQATGGNVGEAARRLGLTREATLHAWLDLPELQHAPRQGLEGARVAAAAARRAQKRSKK